MSGDEGHFGEWVKWNRARKGWNRLRLAGELKVSSKTITNIERRPTPDGIADTTIAGLARVFGVTEREILQGWRGGIGATISFDVIAKDYELLAAVAEFRGVSPADAAKALMLERLEVAAAEVERLGGAASTTATAERGSGNTHSTSSGTPEGEGTTPPHERHTGRRGGDREGERRQKAG